MLGILYSVLMNGMVRPPDDGVHSFWGRLHGGLQVVGGEGDVPHAVVALQGVGDVLVTLH